MYFDVKAAKLLKSPSLMNSASGIPNTYFLSTDPNDLYDRLEFLLQEKQAGNNSNKTTEEIVAIVDKLLEVKGISKQSITHKEKTGINTGIVGIITHINICIHK